MVFPILPMVMSTKAKEVGNEVYEKRQNLKRKMGMNEAPFGPIGMKPGPGCRKFRGASFGSGARRPGGWGFGKKLEKVTFR